MTAVTSVITDFAFMRCGGCSLPFWVPTTWKDRKVSEQGSFWCPNGCSRHFVGETAAERERRRAELLERQLANAQEDARSYRASLIATKGQLTKVRKRADRGVCLHCKRSFANVERHVAHMHPEAVSS